MSGSLKEFAAHRRPGPWCSAYVDAGTGTVDTLEASDVPPGNVRAELEAQGAAKEDLDAMEQALQPAEGQPSPVARFVLVHQGSTELNELLPGPLPGPEQISVSPVPDLLPLLKHRPEVFPYVVAEMSRDHGEIRLHHAGSAAPASVEDVQGETEHLSKSPGGGWSHRLFQRKFGAGTRTRSQPGLTGLSAAAAQGWWSLPETSLPADWSRTSCPRPRRRW